MLDHANHKYECANKFMPCTSANVIPVKGPYLHN